MFGKLPLVKLFIVKKEISSQFQKASIVWASFCPNIGSFPNSNREFLHPPPTTKVSKNEVCIVASIKRLAYVVGAIGAANPRHKKVCATILGYVRYYGVCST